MGTSSRPRRTSPGGINRLPTAAAPVSRLPASGLNLRPEGRSMQNSIAIENIEAMRRQEGIDDVELPEKIRGLRVGADVKAPFLPGTRSLEPLAVRIPRIRGSTFRGKLADRPASTGLSKLRAGSAVAFRTAHIHSIAKRGIPMSSDVLNLDQSNIRAT